MVFYGITCLYKWINRIILSFTSVSHDTSQQTNSTCQNQQDTDLFSFNLDLNNNVIFNKIQDNHMIDKEQESIGNKAFKKDNESNDKPSNKVEVSRENIIQVDEITEISKIENRSLKEELGEDISDILTQAIELLDDRIQIKTQSDVVIEQEPEKIYKLDRQNQETPKEEFVEDQRKEETELEKKKPKKSNSKKIKDENHNLLDEFKFEPKYFNVSQPLVSKVGRKPYFNWYKEYLPMILSFKFYYHYT